MKKLQLEVSKDKFFFPVLFSQEAAKQTEWMVERPTDWLISQHPQVEERAFPLLLEQQ